MQLDMFGEVRGWEDADGVKGRDWDVETCEKET